MNIEADARAAVGWVEDHLGRRQPSFTPAAQAASPQEVPVNISTDIHRVAAVLETLGEDGLAMLEAVAAHPEAVTELRNLATLAGWAVPPGIIAGASGFAAVINVLRPPQTVARPADGTGAQPAQAQARPATEAV